MTGADINTLLNSFDPIGLKQMDEVMLMNRVETKYVFSSNMLPRLLDDLTVSYKVLEINQIRDFPYCTTYLDTPDLFFFCQQVRGKLNRHKVRYRKYESTGDSFLEIKKKTNKNRTIKWRIENFLMPDLDKEALRFIKEYLPYENPDLKPSLINCFKRITLVGKEVKERITLDHNIIFSTPDGKTSEFPFLAIAEIKKERTAGFSPIGNAMKNFGVYPHSFSKYCMGTALVTDVQRKNTLKRNLLLLNKLENEYIESARS